MQKTNTEKTKQPDVSYHSVLIIYILKNLNKRLLSWIKYLEEKKILIGQSVNINILGCYIQTIKKVTLNI